jgi:hypothetical protein
MSFKEEIQLLIEERRKEYENSPKRIITDYTEEKRLTGDYRDRQILELLQNAEDAESTEVLFELNKAEKYLMVSNKGKESFSSAGIDSLMRANLSSKVKKKYIGNKGLGFRSVLNWSQEIRILSNGCEVRFSKDIAQREFKDLQINEDVRNQLIKSKGLKKDVIPMAILALPEVYDGSAKNSEWLTQIKLYYNPDQEISIEIQLKEFSPEALLFLTHINSVRIEGIDKPILHTKDNERIPGKTCLGDEIWEIFSIDEMLDDDYQDKSSEEKEHYNIQIAIQSELTDKKYPLFNYFPTQLTISLPCIIHGTFDLEASRNNLNLTEKNDFILDRVVDQLKSIALSLAERKVNWQPYRILTPYFPISDSPKIMRFYNKLSELRETLEIYPGVDERYHKMETSIYYCEMFSNWVQRNKFGKHFIKVVQAYTADLKIPNEYFKSKYDNETFLKIISSVSIEIYEISERVDFIYLLNGSEFEIYKGYHYPLLLDTQGKVISKDTQVFTLERGSVDRYSIPEFSKLTFIHNELLDKLIIKFQEAIEKVRINDEHRSRPLKRLLDPIINIGSNDILDVARNLVSSLNYFLENIALKNDLVTKDEAINLIVKSLFEIFSEEESRTGGLKTPISLLNRNQEIVKCNDLYLGSEYPSGSITETIFKGIYDSKSYLNGCYLNLIQDEKSAETVEKFLLWLGVNKHVKFKKIDAPKEQVLDYDYINFVYTKLPRPEHTQTSFCFNGLALEDVEKTIAKLSPEKLLLLILNDGKIKERLDFAYTEDQLQYSFHRWYDVYPKPSYIYYQLRKYFNFEDYIIDNNNLKFVNKFPINYQDPIFQKNNITEQSINQVLLLLGAKTNFSELSPERIYEILKEYNELDITGETTQTFYKLALNILEKREYNPTKAEIENLKVFAKTGNKRIGDWIPAEQVYYSNDTVLPASITKSKYILNVPKRFGEDKVKKFLGVNLFNEFELNIFSETIELNHQLSLELMDELGKLRPYFLGYRLKEIASEKDKERAANQFKSFKVHLVNNCLYSTKDKGKIVLKENEFVRSNNDFYLCINKNSSFLTLKNSPMFCDAIADIICLVCKVWGLWEQFRVSFKYGIKELEHQFELTGEDQSLATAKQLLGISPAQFGFWRAIYKTQNLPFKEELSAEELFYQNILLDLKIDIAENHNKVDFVKYDTQESIHFLNYLCETLPKKISLKDIHNVNPEFLGIMNWHFKSLITESEKLQKKFDYALWFSLSTMSFESQKTYLMHIDRYSQFIAKRKWEEINAFDFHCDYYKILREALENEFKISFNIEFAKDLIVRNHYSDLLLKYKIEYSELSSSEQSLFNFPNHSDLIINLLEEKKPNNSFVENEPIVDLNNTVVGSGSLIELSSPSINLSITHDLSSPGVHNNETDRAKKKAGKKAETIVVNWLRNKYQRENVTWISAYSDEPRKNDKAGYDVRYRLSQDSEDIYVEVKSYSGSSFIISANEIRKGLVLKEKYHLALVKDQSIYFVTDYFVNELRKVEFEALNSNNSIRPLDYEIYFKLPENKIEL